VHDNAEFQILQKLSSHFLVVTNAVIRWHEA